MEEMERGYKENSLLRPSMESIIARAWRDEEYLESLSESLRSQIPESSVGDIDFGVVYREGHTPKMWAGTVATTCSTVATSCSTVATSCSTVATSCSTVSTHCSTVATTCSTVATKCSTVATTCSTVATKCSTVATTCSTVATSCSTVATDCGRRRRRR